MLTTSTLRSPLLHAQHNPLLLSVCVHMERTIEDVDALTAGRAKRGQQVAEVVEVAMCVWCKKGGVISVQTQRVLVKSTVGRCVCRVLWW